MSIIHDALKKAERERGPWSTGLPVYPGVRMGRRRWRWGITIGMLTGVATVAVSTWLGLQSLVGAPRDRTVMQTLQSSPARVPRTADQAHRQAVVAPPMAVAKLFEARSMPDKSLSPAAPVSRAFEPEVNAEAAFERARSAESTGQWEQAARYYRQALALNPALVEAHNNLGNLFIRQQQMTAAIDEFQAAIALNPDYAMVRNNLGSAYVLIGEEALAIQEFIAALRIDGAYVSPYYNLASLYARRGDVGQAVAFLTKALALEAAVLSWLQADPDFDGIRAAPAFQRLRAQAQVRR
jgi:tetratricopeptide (TPR) repeat protein